MRARLVRDEATDYSNVGRTNDEWPDHRARTLVTSSLLQWMAPDSVLDPACGDGSIVRLGINNRRYATVTLSDLSKPNIDAVRKWARPYGWATSIADAFTTLDAIPGVDVVVLTEILEHLEDPESLLRLARLKGQRLLVSSPEMRPGQIDSNPEHLWQFDGEGYEAMLNETGWKSVHKSHLTFRSMYDFQIWVCDRG